MHCEFPPPYSPDYNPIKLIFSTMNYHLQHDGVYIQFVMNELEEEENYSILVKVACNITPQDTWGWYRHCGYV